MPTIVEYTDRKAAEARWPERIVSPTRPGRCCATGMEAVGHPHQDGNWTYQYTVCQRCGFAVRRILSWLPDAGEIESLREFFERNVVRGYEG